ncbi:MAG: hypothetical protein IPK91_15120 [Saprospiraceae bacterium]|nr:hypothetical protein [Saprospiraceae bacterium]
MISLTLIFSVLISCTKNEKYEINAKNTTLTPRSVIAEEYVYDGIHYILYFNAEDTSGVPNNTSTADSLIYAIGDSDIFIEYDYDYPDIIFINNIPTPEEIDSTEGEAIPTGLCLYAQFYEHINFTGESFCVDPSPGFEADTEKKDEFNYVCSRAWGESDLGDRPYGMSGNWNDRISSFKLFKDGASKDKYNEFEFTGYHSSVKLTLYRDSYYSNGSNKYKTWTMHDMSYLDEAPWEIPNLKKERWVWWSTNMNDSAGSISLIGCKTEPCNGRCLNPFDAKEFFK